MGGAVLATGALLIGGTAMGTTTLGIRGNQFTLNGKPTFLVGISYYGALAADEAGMREDLDEMQRHGFNWFRVWATWFAFDHDVSAVHPDGRPREPFLGRLKWLLEECDRRGMVVDITLSRWNGVTGPPRLKAHEEHRRAVETLVTALKPYRNWYLDLANERNIRDARYTSYEELAALRRRVRELDPSRLVTASHAGDIPRDELDDYVLSVGVDFVTPHRPRDANSPKQTEAKTREYLAWMKEFGRVVPVHYQEPFRRDFGRWNPTGEDFLVDLQGAIAGDAAGWCFHNGDNRQAKDGRPRRSFDLREGRLFAQLNAEERKAVEGIRALFAWKANPSTRTRVGIQGTQWRINDQITYPGAKAEGLLMNVRMVNCVFEDAKRPDFDPEANTSRFIARIPEYAAHGVRAFTICLQGGFPGYEGAVNSAFNADGSLRETYLARVRRVIEACDRNGCVVILGLYYQRQDQILKDEEAVKAGVVNVARWVRENRFGNVILEIANEYPHKGFDHAILRTPEGIASLIRLARQEAPGLLISASGIGNGRLDAAVAEASDFLLIHFNGVPLSAIPERIQALKGYGKPIVCNEDQKVGNDAAQAARLSVENGASWGLMLEKVNQHFPFHFQGAADDPVVYATFRELTTP